MKTPTCAPVAASPAPLWPWLLAGLLGGPVLAEDGQFTLSAGLDYSSGRYGGASSTDMLYAPVILKFERGPSTFKLSVPYLRISAPDDGEVIDVGPDGQPVYGGSGRRVSREGLGDVVVTYTHAALREPWHNWLADLGAKVKLPTADEGQRLGTGKVDFVLLADLYYLAGRTSPFLSLEYRMPGDPAGVSLRNVWGMTLGLGHQFSAQDSAGLMAYARQALRPDSPEPLELSAYWTHRFSSDTKLQGYATKGWSDASPEYEIGFTFSLSH